MTVLAMSHGELSRYDTLRRFERGELRIEDAAMLLGVGRRQVYRLLDRLRKDGPEGLVSCKRGRPSNRAFKAEMRANVLGLVREHYHNFGPTLAAEYLAERHEIKISHETLRKWMIQAGLWKDRDARRPRPYQLRYRRNWAASQWSCWGWDTLDRGHKPQPFFMDAKDLPHIRGGRADAISHKRSRAAMAEPFRQPSSLF